MKLAERSILLQTTMLDLPQLGRTQDRQDMLQEYAMRLKFQFCISILLIWMLYYELVNLQFDIGKNTEKTSCSI